MRVCRTIVMLRSSSNRGTSDDLWSTPIRVSNRADIVIENFIDRQLTPSSHKIVTHESGV